MIESEYEKGHHSLMIAPIGRACAACGSRTRYFCYGCSADAPTVVHCCSSARDGPGTAMHAYISQESQITTAGIPCIVEGGELPMQRMPNEKGVGENNSRIQRSPNHGNLLAQRKVANSILITTINQKDFRAVLLYYRVCCMEL